MADQNMDMDAILDEALDELENDENEGYPGENQDFSAPNPLQPKDRLVVETVFEEPNRDSSVENVTSPEAVFQNMLRDFIQAEDDGTDPDERIGQFMDQVQAQLPPDEDEKDKSTTEKSKSGIEQTIAGIIEEMSKAHIGDAPDIDPKDFNFDPESFNPDAVIDGMMESLLSKDLMYEPMKQVTEKFPGWLHDNKETLPPGEYEKRNNQYECFKKLVYVYENDPENTTELLELMQQVQEYGQPPQDIISEIAPGLELDDEGMPKINPMDGITGLGDNEECKIM